MEIFTKNPGLQHVSEDIFKLLDNKSLLDCRLVNSSWKNILDQPMFWLKNLDKQNLPLDIQKSWENLVEKLTDDQISNKLVLIMIKVSKGTYSHPSQKSKPFKDFPASLEVRVLKSDIENSDNILSGIRDTVRGSKNQADFFKEYRYM